MNCFFQQDYIEEKEYIITTSHNVSYMFSTKQIPQQMDFNITEFNDNIGTITITNEKQQKQIQTKIVVLAVSHLQSFSSIVPSSELFEVFNSTIKNITRYELAEEILKNIDDKLNAKIFEDGYLNKVFITSLVKIKEYLEKRNIRYEWEAFVWNDIDESHWEENIISIKIKYNNNTEKRKIWKEISSIVEKTDRKGISFITEIKRL